MSTDFRDVIFWIIVVFCAAAQLFIIRAVLRTVPRATTSSVPVPRRSLEIAWVILPALLLTVTLIGAWRLMHTASP